MSHPKLKEELWENTDKDGDDHDSVASFSPFSAPDGHKNELFFSNICLIKTDAVHKIL